MLTILKEAGGLTDDQAEELLQDTSKCVRVGLCEHTLEVGLSEPRSHWVFEGTKEGVTRCPKAPHLFRVYRGTHRVYQLDWYIYDLKELDNECEQLIEDYKSAFVLMAGDKFINRRGETLSVEANPSGELWVGSNTAGNYVYVDGKYKRHYDQPENKHWDLVRLGQEFPYE